MIYNRLLEIARTTAQASRLFAMIATKHSSLPEDAAALQQFADELQSSSEELFQMAKQIRPSPGTVNYDVGMTEALKNYNPPPCGEDPASVAARQRLRESSPGYGTSPE